MDLALTKWQELLKSSVREFAEKEIKPIAKELDEKEEFPYANVKAMGKLGLLGILVDEEYGGQEMDYLSYILAVEEIARVDVSHAVIIAAGNSLGIDLIYRYGLEKQKKKYLPKACKGETLWAFGLTEPNAGSDAGGTETAAISDGNNWTINGQKMFISNTGTDITAGVIVLCKTGTRNDGKPELTSIIVESGTPGFESNIIHNKMVWRASATSELYFDNCIVPEENILGAVGEGFHQMLSSLDRGRLSIAGLCLGVAQGSFEMGLKYAKKRTQFGKTIASFQVNAFKLADMATEIEAARTLLYKACWLKDSGKPFTKHASMAKLFCSEVAARCVNHAIQLHGGYGLMKDYDIERFYRDCRALEIVEGTSEVQRLVISRALLT